MPMPNGKESRLLTPEEEARQRIAWALLNAGVIFLEGSVFVRLVNALYGACEEYHAKVAEYLIEEKEKEKQEL